ncbi:MAG: DUF4184 family protein [Microbacterium sp.]|uniref:DUF4184 family protein n=1 Tax=Microbacterium sp. TaxID=51671 RepID=UPI0039E723C1
MPFTPSHAVVALPFLPLRRVPALAGVPAAVAVGAMTPDLPLFVRGTPVAYAWTHSFSWLPLTAVLALVLLLVWRCALRPASRELAPRWLARRLPSRWDAGASTGLRETFPSAAGALWTLLALAVGAVSHIAWDLVTHEGRAGIAALDEAWGPLPAHTWLQHGSSAVGLVTLAVCAIVWLRRADAAEQVRRVLPDGARWGWWLSLPLALVVAWCAGYAVLGPFAPGFDAEHLAYRVLPPACGVWGAATLALCATVQAVRLRGR